MTQKFQNISIEAIAACVPKKVIKGEYFSELLDDKELRKFERTTGILERRYVDSNTTASDLGFKAAKKILDEQNCKDEIKALIFLSQTSDYKIPFTSNILQDRLGLSKEILCLDINAGCAGFIQGLSVCYSLANSIDGKVLLIVAETLSRILSPLDKSTNTLFGDGAAAVLVAKDKSNYPTYFNFFSDGNKHAAIMIPDGGYKSPFSLNSLEWREGNNGGKSQGLHLTMDGAKVFDFTLREIPESIELLLKKSGMKIDEIDAFLLHQSNKFIIKQIASKLDIPIDKVLFNIDKFGNTSGVTIPLLMVTELNPVMKYNKLLLSGYGSGLNWGNCVISLSPNLNIYNILEL